MRATGLGVLATLVIVSPALVTPAAAEFRGRGGGGAAPAPHISAPAPRISAPAAAPHFSAPAPHVAGPRIAPSRGVQPRIAHGPAGPNRPAGLATRNAGPRGGNTLTATP